jgi:hypothetical protein
MIRMNSKKTRDRNDSGRRFKSSLCCDGKYQLENGRATLVWVLPSIHFASRLHACLPKMASEGIIATALMAIGLRIMLF